MGLVPRRWHRPHSGFTRHESGALTPDAKLTGHFEQTLKPVDQVSVVCEIDDAPRMPNKRARLLRMAENR